MTCFPGARSHQTHGHMVTDHTVISCLMLLIIAFYCLHENMSSDKYENVSTTVLYDMIKCIRKLIFFIFARYLSLDLPPFSQMLNYFCCFTSRHDTLNIKNKQISILLSLFDTVGEKLYFVI